MIASGKVNKALRGFVVAAVFIAAVFFGFQQAAWGSSQFPPESENVFVVENRIAPDRILRPSLSYLHRFERQQAAPVSAPADFTGFGDLRQYENQLEALRPGRSLPVGMGDVQLFDARK